MADDTQGNYTTDKKEFATYHFDSSEGVVEGTATDNIVVKYYYVPNRYTVTAKYYQVMFREKSL